MQLRTGSSVGTYEIVSPLGAGGMGEVYRARDPRLGREVAIKVLPASFAASGDRLRRFEQEARAAGALNHPNLLTIFELGTHEGAPFIVSELIEGSTLRELLGDHEPLPIKRATEIAVQLANGLAAAHDKGIVHRDLKPENVLITGDGRVKLLDFGLAKLLDNAPINEEATFRQETHPGVVVGTVAYMSPEQVRGATVDHRCDVFALGSLLHEMLIGTPPFRRESQVETMNAILKDDPPPFPAGRLTPALERIILHALEKNPTSRFQSMRDIAFSLEMLSGSGEATTLSKQKKGAAAKKSEKIVPVATPTFQRLTFRRGFLMNARFAPDGTILYGAAWDDQPVEVYSTIAGTRHSRAVGLAGSDILSISPAGELAVSLGRRYLTGWVSSGTLARVPPFGGAPREICEEVQDAVWGPDGKNFLILRRLAGTFRLEYPIGNVIFESVNWISQPRVSPKGDMIAFIDHPLYGDDAGALVIINFKGKELARSTSFLSTGGLAWTPKGDEVWMAAERAETGRDIVGVSLSGKERTILSAPGRLSLYDISRDGVVLLSFDNCRREIMGGSLGQLLERNLSWFEWSFLTAISHDGKRILFEEQGAFSREGGEYQIYIRGTDGSPSVSIGEGYGRAISADMKWAVAKTGHPPRLEFLPTGAGQAREIPVRGLQAYYSWNLSTDGKQLVIAGNEPDHGNRIYVIDLDGDGIPRPISPEGTSAPMALSHDGKWVVASTSDRRLMIFATDGSEPQPLRGSETGERPLAWTDDGESIFVSGQGRVSMAIHRVSVASGERSLHHTIRPGDPAGIMDIQPVMMTPDGQHYAYGYRRYLSDLFVVHGMA
jgi:Tol biopolymer transport system component/predicted Ser/Thr protein kinase